ncbi:MAG: hypothetical protein RL662_924 [Bacteroidota bacterium]
MQDNSSVKDDSETPLFITKEAYGFLREIGKWTKFFVVLWGVSLFFMIVFFAFTGAMLGVVQASMGLTSPVASLWVTVLMPISMALTNCPPLYYLYRFSNNISKALAENNADELASAFRFLKSHYKFLGILTIIVLFVYVVLVVFFVTGGVMALIG